MKFIAKEIVRENDRTLIYGHPKWPDYHVIGKADAKVKVGDEIEYEEDGWNFGWLKEKVK